jgi:hypothetical protein
MHDIDRIATQQGEERLPDCRRHRRCFGCRRLQQENIDQLRKYEPGDHPYYPTRPVGALEPRIIGAVRDDDVEPMQVLEATAKRSGRDKPHLFHEERIAG